VVPVANDLQSIPGNCREVSAAFVGMFAAARAKHDVARGAALTLAPAESKAIHSSTHRTANASCVSLGRWSISINGQIEDYAHPVRVLCNVSDADGNLHRESSRIPDIIPE
jgi:hypothetical protein